MAEMVLTQNFKTLVNAILLGTTSVSSNSSTGNTARSYEKFTASSEPRLKSSFKDTSGTEKKIISKYVSATELVSFAQEYGSLNRIASNNTGANSNYRFLIGRGSTPATVNDYSLEQYYSLNSDFNIENVSNYMKNINGKTVMQTIITVTARRSLSITEFGFFLVAFSKSSQGAAEESYEVLLGRCVFDEAVTLANDESKTFEFTLSLF